MYFANSTFAFQKQWIIDPVIVAPLDQMKWAMQQLGELRRDRLTKLKDQCYKDEMTKEEEKAKKLLLVDREQWMALVDYWFLPKT